jgi:hypothetical protein
MEKINKIKKKKRYPKDDSKEITSKETKKKEKL